MSVRLVIVGADGREVRSAAKQFNWPRDIEPRLLARPLVFRSPR